MTTSPPPESPPPAPRSRRRWLSFRLRTLLVIAPLLAILLSWGFSLWYQREVQARAVFEVERLKGTLLRDKGAVVGVELSGKQITDKELERLAPHLAAFPQLKTVVLAGSEVTDAGLQHLARVPQLEVVRLVGMQNISTDGIAALQSRSPKLTIDVAPFDPKATRLAMRTIHRHATLALARSPEGHLVAGSGDGRVKIWDPGRRVMVDSFAAHEDWTFAVAFHPNGNVLATGGGDNLIKLWDWSSRREIGRLIGHDDDVHAVRFTPDGRTLVSTSDDWTVRVWDLATRQVRHVLTGHEGTIPGLALNASGTLAASASRDGTVRLWDVSTGESRGVLRGHARDVMSVDFHPDGKLLASASYDRTVIAWDTATGQAMHTLGGHNDWVFAAAWSPDGEQLISAAGDGVRAFRIADEEMLWHSASQENVSHVLWLDPSRLASSSADSSIVLHDPAGRHLADLWPVFSDAREIIAARQ